MIQGNLPLYEENCLWEALSVVSQKWSFPTALFLSNQNYFFHLQVLDFALANQWYVKRCHVPSGSQASRCQLCLCVMFHIYNAKCPIHKWQGPLVVPFLTLCWGEGSPTKIDYRKKGYPYLGGFQSHVDNKITDRQATCAHKLTISQGVTLHLNGKANNPVSALRTQICKSKVKCII